MKIIDLHSPSREKFVYCGRFMPGRSASPLRNPYRVKQYGGETLPLYRRWLWERIQANDPDVLGALRALSESSILACWCVELEGERIFSTPEVCHGQIIAKAWRWLQAGGRIPGIHTNPSGNGASDELPRAEP